jgi:hypothetical protein
VGNTINWLKENSFLVLEILHGVQDKFPDDVSGPTVGPIFIGHESERKRATEWDTALHGRILRYAAAANLI